MAAARHRSQQLRTPGSTIGPMVQPRASPASPLRVPFGVGDGRMWLPREVPTGLACRCTCPGCGQPLLAKNAGPRRQAHFAHHAARACSGAFESAVHRMAKQLICERQRLVLPAWNGAEGMPNPMEVKDDNGGKLRSQPVDFPARESRLRRAVAEVALQDYRPDVVAEDDEGELLIEIRVSHAVGELKARNVRSEGRRMIEIDLSRVTPTQAEDPELFERLVLDHPRNRTWIACPRATDAWRASRDELQARLAHRNKELAADKRRWLEAVEWERQEEHQSGHQERQRMRAGHARDLEYLMREATADAISERYARMLERDAPKAEALLSRAPPALQGTLRNCNGAAWGYRSHYLLWQPAMYFQFVDGKPIGHPIRRTELGRWLRATFGVDPILWRLFMAQWRARKEARTSGRKAYSLSLWYLTPAENRAIPNFFQCLTDFVDRMMAAGAIRFDPEQGGDLIVAGSPEIEESSARPPWDPRTDSPHDPLLETGTDPYIDRWITHSKLGVGIIRERVAKGSPSYKIWFNGARWRTVWLGDPLSGGWKLLERASAPDRPLVDG